MWGAFVGLIETTLGNLQPVLGSWGLAIILFTAVIKLLTWPLTSKQLKSSKAMQDLQPKVKAIQEKYKDDKEAQTREMMALYQEMGVNPMMGCFPILIQFPIWIGLYQAIVNLANEGTLGEGFWIIPSLAKPNGIGWVADFFQNFSQHAGMWPYFILPIMTVITQIIVSRFMTPATPSSGNSNDPTQGMMKSMTTFMPIMFGFFALQFPAGLALYWVTNNVLTGVQYAVLNPTLSLAPVGAAEGNPVINNEPQQDDQPTQSDKPKGQKDGKSRRKRKKRRG